MQVEQYGLVTLTVGEGAAVISSNNGEFSPTDWDEAVRRARRLGHELHSDDPDVETADGGEVYILVPIGGTAS